MLATARRIFVRTLKFRVSNVPSVAGLEPVIQRFRRCVLPDWTKSTATLIASMANYSHLDSLGLSFSYRRRPNRLHLTFRRKTFSLTRSLYNQ